MDPASATPDTQFHFATLSADMAGGKVHPFSGCTYSVCQLRPSSRGHVRLRSADPFEAPSMQPNYLSTELDRRMAVAAVKYARRLAAEPLAGLMKREFRPGPEVREDDEILHFCREYGATIFHPSGTAKMGPADDPLAVVDERLRARRGRTARGRLLGHADAGVGQHECARDHAGRARGRIHIAGTVPARDARRRLAGGMHADGRGRRHGSR